MQITIKSGNWRSKLMDECEKEQQPCSLCGATLVLISKEFAGMRKEKGPLSRSIIKYRLVWCCPRTQRPFAWFERGHSRIETIEEQ